MIAAHALRLVAGRRSLVTDLAFEVRTGEFCAVLGPNGAGKSTLLRALAGEVRPAAGTIRIFDRPLERFSPRELAQRRAVVAQHSTLEANFTALEVVLLGRLPHPGRGDSAQDLQIAARALGQQQLEAERSRAYPTLSGGERQRVHWARALAQVWAPDQSRVLLLDEPTASLDPVFQHRALGWARAFARQGTAVVCVLHDLNLAAQYADTVLLLGPSGYAFGRKAEVLTAANIKRFFDFDVLVLPHPRAAFPLIVPLGAPECRP